ncbi:MAG: DUF2149 domain-containing protein [Myxococcota bacterium]
MRDRFRSRFESDTEPMAVMGNLVDVMLVFACGLIAALLASSPELRRGIHPDAQDITRGRELPRLPDAAQEGGAGMERVGQVYRDPETGKLILIGD